MITNAIIILIGWVLGLIALLAPTWTVWPQGVIDGIAYFFAQIGKLNFIFPIDTLMQAIEFLNTFAILYFSAKILIMAVNWFRGVGEIKI